MTLSPSIAPELRSRLEQLISTLDAAAARAAAAAKAAEGGTLSSIWRSAVGTESTLAAARAHAASQATLARNVRGRVERARTSDDALAILRDAASSNWMGGLEDLEQLARSLTASGGVGVIARDSAKDAAAVAVAVGNSTIGALKLAPFALLAVGIWWLSTLARKVTP